MEESIDHHHFMIYKPDGYLSQFITNDVKSSRKKLLGSLYDFPKNAMSVGRLDEKSEGLLIITTDGKLSNTINSNKVEKEYYAQVDGMITPEAIKTLSQGVEIGLNGKKYQTTPCKAFKVENIPQFPERGKKLRDDRHGPTSWLSITLTEGKFRQVRKMTAAVGFPTLRLIRVRIGKLKLDTMTAGEVRILKEVHY
ncbi:pseudouridine synthase [Flavobacteriaceae bacterium R38]|nr:pseudouridine synthase [Flavobacteriaceae bacterium R38]